MSAADSDWQPAKPIARRDGWTPERQLRFLDALARTGRVAEAAALAGMGRESAYRLRNRPGGALFGLLWDRALRTEPAIVEGHNPALSDGALARLLGMHFRGDCAISRSPALAGRGCSGGDRTGTS